MCRASWSLASRTPAAFRMAFHSRQSSFGQRTSVRLAQDEIPLLPAVSGSQPFGGLGGMMFLRIGSSSGGHCKVSRFLPLR